MTKKIALTALAAAAAAAAPAAHAASTELAAPTHATPVAAWNQDIAWSAYDPDLNAYRLVVSEAGGAPRTLPVAPSPRPFDVDLGTNRNGSVYAVYTRCQKLATCDIYRTSLATGNEQLVRKLSSPHWDEREPTILAGRIAFIRHERSHGHMRDVLRIGTTVSASHGSRALVKARHLRDPELSNDHVAYVERVKGRHGPSMQVHVRRVHGGHDRVVYRANSGGANFADVTGPSVSGSLKSFLWVRTNLGSGAGNRVVRYSVHSGRLAYARGTSSAVTSSGWAGGRLGMAYSESLQGTCTENVTDPPSATICRVGYTGPLTFHRRP